MMVPWKFGLIVVEAAKELRSRTPKPEFVDQEVIPPFDGSSAGIFLWFICETEAQSSTFKERLIIDHTRDLKTIMIELGFPSDAADTLQTDVTSKEAIAVGGGRFAFFR